MSERTPLHIQGHRGYGINAPHNSIKGFELAGKHPNVKSVEFDVRCTADGHLVITHGPEVGHLSETEKLSFEDVCRVDIGDGERIPLLSEVMDVCVRHNLGMNVELKTKHALEGTIKMLREFPGALPLASISSFDRSVLKKIIELEPSIPIGSLYNAMQENGLRTPTPGDFATWNGESRPEDTINMCVELVTAEDVKDIHAANKKAMVWFPVTSPPGFEESPAMVKKMMDFGVDIVCVNDIDIWESACANPSQQ
eukprot:GEMP01041680.1.p1 GENE.GEMP01041680.1~~GEMP01041680.1.p1  ORF type:complete len:254 (+),score=75.60 GEMP01041680.1:282-1043(+)